MVDIWCIYNLNLQEKCRKLRVLRCNTFILKIWLCKIVDKFHVWGNDSKKGLFPPPWQFFIQVSAENFDCVTIFFGDIVGFNDLTNDCSATEVIESEIQKVVYNNFTICLFQLIDFMNHFYCNLDARLEKFQVEQNQGIADQGKLRRFTMCTLWKTSSWSCLECLNVMETDMSQRLPPWPLTSWQV